SAGCSSGEEAYSIAFTVLESLPGVIDWDVRVLASDIDTDVLARAERGVYLAERAAGVPTALRERYFLRGRGANEGLVRVRPEAARLASPRSSGRSSARVSPSVSSIRSRAWAE